MPHLIFKWLWVIDSIFCCESLSYKFFVITPKQNPLISFFFWRLCFCSLNRWQESIKGPPLMSCNIMCISLTGIFSSWMIVIYCNIFLLDLYILYNLVNTKLEVDPDILALENLCGQYSFQCSIFFTMFLFAGSSIRPCLMIVLERLPRWWKLRFEMFFLSFLTLSIVRMLMETRKIIPGYKALVV